MGWKYPLRPPQRSSPSRSDGATRTFQSPRRAEVRSRHWRRSASAHCAVGSGPQAGLQPLKWEPGAERPAFAGRPARAPVARATVGRCSTVAVELTVTLSVLFRVTERAPTSNCRAPQRSTRRQEVPRRRDAQLQAPTSAVAGPSPGRPQPRSGRPSAAGAPTEASATDV